MKLVDLIKSYLSRESLLWFFLIFFGYLIGTQFSYFFFTAPAVFPLQSGIALAGLVLGGIRLWPAVFIAALVVYFFNGLSPFLAVMFALGSTLQAGLGAYVLRAIAFDPALQRMRDIFALVGVALVASAIVPTVGLVGYEIHEMLGGTGLTIPWNAWWVGHMLSLLIVSPFLIRWLTPQTLPYRAREFQEIVIALIALAGLNYLLFFTFIEQIAGISVLYVWLIPFFWISLRLGPSIITLGLLMTSAMALVGTALGLASATSQLPLGEQLLVTEAFLVAIAVMFFILTAVVEERRSAVRALRDHVAKLEDFIAVFAHEIRNPLSPVVSSLELLEMRSHDSETIQTVKVMEKHLTTTRRLLDDLLDMSRISKQKLRVEKEPMDLANVLLLSLRAADEFFEARGQHISVSLPEGPIQIMGDPTRLQQVFTNLLNNASKFTPEGGSIRVEAERVGNEVIVVVRDNGDGIASDMLKKIFEPFIQIDRSPGSQKGLGIGLALAKQIVETHGGTIVAKSEGEARGSEFIVRLPLS